MGYREEHSSHEDSQEGEEVVQRDLAVSSLESFQD